jgi:hypothetical protein
LFVEQKMNVASGAWRRVAVAIRFLMMNAMRRDPEDRTALERERSAERQEILDPLVGLVAAVRQQPVIGHPDPQHAADEVQNERREQRALRHEEERRNRSDVEGRHRDGGDPVQTFLILAPVQERRLHHGICPPVLVIGEKPMHDNNPDGGRL